jgi:hypothetical protein
MSEEFAGLAFEGEWSFLKNLTGRGTTTAKRAAERMVPRAKDLFSAATSSPARADGDSNGSGWPSSGEAGRQRSRTSQPAGPADAGSRADVGSSRPTSISDFDSLGRSSPTTTAAPLVQRASEDAAAAIAVASAPVTPRTLTTFLTSALVVLQLYEVNPAVITQAVSQCFYWIGCETFNRILTRKRYLCRSKAVQIRMNLTALADWVRDADLPGQISTRHLEPAVQLLGWIQTCSALDDFDGLIVTLSSLRALNPLQMRRAVRDYRYEVGEGRMSDECAQYLTQLQKDWERRRVRLGVETLQRERRSAEIEQRQRQALRLDVYGSAAGPSAAAVAHDPAAIAGGQAGAEPNPARAVDLLFDPDVPLGQYAPPPAPESLGELLDSRFMLPFCLPTEIDLLAATPPPDAAFAFLLPPAAATSGCTDPTTAAAAAGGLRSGVDGGLLPSLLSLGSPRPSSRSSFASLRPLRYVARRHRPLRELPLDFLAWLDSQAADRHAVAARAEAHGAASAAAAADGRQARAPSDATSSLPARLKSLVADHQPDGRADDGGTLRRIPPPASTRAAGDDPDDGVDDSTVIGRSMPAASAEIDDFGVRRTRPAVSRSTTATTMTSSSSSSSFSTGPAVEGGHGRDVSDASTIVGRAFAEETSAAAAEDGTRRRLDASPALAGARHRPPPLELGRIVGGGGGGLQSHSGSAPGSPSPPTSAGSPGKGGGGGWFKSRKTTLRTLISGGGVGAAGTP